MPENRKADGPPRAVRDVVPVEFNVGCFDEPTHGSRGIVAEPNPNERPWIEITAIAIVLLSGVVSAIVALAKL